MPNRLSQESSPYLLQHANNPVDWYTWGEEALAKAKSEDKPIFLSIGYSACHWCHVMERESFENKAIAILMNQFFINIKIDREERPDLDTIYMEAVVAMTGQGGWPLSVFLTPDGLPFYGGTYFPPTPRYGMPSFEQVLQAITEAYHTKKDYLATNTQALLQQIKSSATLSLQANKPLDDVVSELATQAIAQSFDRKHGGLNEAPKFPQPMIYEFLLQAYYRNPKENLREMVELTLQKMAAGGIYDQLGGGFHRYSTDDRWLAPHFEKMLYDNALLARLYLHAYQLTGQALYRQVVEETLDYVAREMIAPEGGFYSTQDADSAGEEGKFFLWTPAEIEAVLGAEEGRAFCMAYGVTAEGNFEGKNILHLDHTTETLTSLRESLHRSRNRLFMERQKRVKPSRDEKIITSWNGLMLAAFAEAAQVLEREDYASIATRNAEFILTTMQKEGRLYRTWKAGNAQAKLNGYLEDYACYADGLLALYQTTFKPRWFQAARQLMDAVLTHFTDHENGGFFDTADDHETLISRPKNLSDNAMPCGNSMTARVLLKLATLTGQANYRTPALNSISALQEKMSQYPTALAYWLGTLEFALTSPKEIALIGPLDHPTMQAMRRALFAPYRPQQVVAWSDGLDYEGQPELVQNRPTQADQPTAYVCQNFTCQNPVTTVTELESLL